MPPLVIRLLFIFVLMFVLNSVRLFFVNRPIKNRVEMPSKIQRIGLGLMVFVTFLIGFMALLGLRMREAEMGIVSLVLTLIFATLVFFTRRKFKKIYHETATSAP